MNGAKPYPYDSWTGVQGAQTDQAAAAQVQEEEAALSPEQQAQLQQLQQQKGRHLLQGPKTQAQINEIGEINKVNGAKPYPYDSWTGVHGAQSDQAAAAQVQEEEAALSPEQQQQLHQLQAN